MWFRIFIFGCCFQNVILELFTTYVNFEKYYQMEEELIALTDLIIQQEKIIHGEDHHDFMNISHLVDKAKEIHGKYAEDPESYLFHPINTFHLSKRLAWNWKTAVKQIMETDTCVKALRVKLQNMDDNIPTDDQLSKIAVSILNLDIFYNKTIDHLLSGEISDTFPFEHLSLSDIVYIAKAAYDQEQYFYTITWLNHVVQEMKTRHLQSLDDVYGKATIYNLLASGYFKMNHIEKAKEITDGILLFEPENEKAVRNRVYYSSVMAKAKPLNIEKPIPREQKQRLHNLICNRSLEKKQSNGKCLFFPLRNKIWYMKSDIKAEVIKNKPLIIVFHSLIDNKTANALKYMGHEQLMNVTTQYRYSYPRQSSALNDKSHWKWVPKLKEMFYSMDISPMPPRNSKFNVMNIGLDGFVRQHTTEKTVLKPVGSFIVALVNGSIGGELVFPLSKIKISLEKGDAVFYEEEIPFTICPVAYGTQWYGVQYLFEGDYPKDVCPPQRKVKRGYKL